MKLYVQPRLTPTTTHSIDYRRKGSSPVITFFCAFCQQVA